MIGARAARRATTRATFATLATTAALAATAALTGCRWGGPEAEGGAAPPPVEVELPRPSRVLYPAAPVSFVDVVRDARPAVVAIKSPTPVKSGPAAMFPGAPPTAADPALGTGFLIAAGGSFVVTNDHIVADVADVRVVMVDGTELPARVVGRDPRLDLALLAVEAPRLPALRLGDSDQLAVGEWVVALGNPFGDEVTAAAGIVSATGRDAAATLVPGPAMGFRTFLQVDARIHRGNSGGPILSTAGEVVGVAVATGDRPGELSFAVPAARLREVLEPLKTYGSVRRAWLGVLARPVTRELAAQLTMATVAGAIVTEVKAGSPAAKAGLRPGDVITAWDGKPVDARALPWLAANAPIGRAVALAVWRDRAQVTIDLVPEPMPE
ncbi:MAG: trypsin-like peptidase domain-containing protein [Kofleriaceae bacterium]|nr:trypsin-like peptidase domain-containing protein [Kofleriaceae bacterium]MBP9168291.1 trypsin-like peptidase domain-containing protein [Kofleriaceae bacterium]MBP9862875.1 trypsin-like peptidase domain-containing protein [Kofleriaceae bacterium]